LTGWIIICIINQRVIYQHATLACQSPQAHRRTGSRTRGHVHAEARRELASLDLGFDDDDACDILAKLTTEDSAGRLKSAATGEWMYLFKPRLSGLVLYVKLVIRGNCIVISFHEDAEDRHEEDA
jgi:hypothetical protein